MKEVKPNFFQAIINNLIRMLMPHLVMLIYWKCQDMLKKAEKGLLICLQQKLIDLLYILTREKSQSNNLY